MKRGIVLYTDGGAQPNPGLSGWGCHGYIYTDDKPSKKILDGILLTDKGYKTELGDKDIEVTVEKFFEFLGANGISTNNASEINSLYYSLDKLLEEDFESIYVLVDSEYVRKGITEWSSKWIKNDWIREDGNPVSNKDEWERLLNTIQEYKTLKKKMGIYWIKGHNGDIGNTIADTLCNIAINTLKSENINTFLPIYMYFEPYLYYNLKPERNPYLSFKRVLFNSVAGSKLLGYYFLEDSDKEEKYIGRKQSNASYGVIKLNKPDDLIEIVRQKQTEVSEDLNVVMLLKLDRMYETDIYRYVRDYGKYFLKRKDNYNLNLFSLNNKPITVELDPPGLSIDAMYKFNNMETLLLDVLEGNSQHTLIDITDKIYEIEQDKKGNYKYKIHSNIKVNSSDIEIKINYKEKDFSIILNLGKDILNRSNLKKLETLTPTIKLVLVQESQQSFSYYVYINSQIGSGVWSNINTNSIYFQ